MKVTTGLKSRRRRGSALLFCILAATVLSVAAIAILRSGEHGIARVEALKTGDTGRHAAEGLVQRAIATLRVDPAFNGAIIDPANGFSNARCDLTRLSPNATQIRVFLYAGSTVPATDIVVDPTAL